MACIYCCMNCSDLLNHVYHSDLKGGLCTAIECMAWPIRRQPARLAAAMLTSSEIVAELLCHRTMACICRAGLLQHSCYEDEGNIKLTSRAADAYASSGCWGLPQIRNIMSLDGQKS